MKILNCLRLQDMTSHIPVFLWIDTFLWLSCWGEMQWVGQPAGCWNSLLSLCHCAWHRASQWTDTLWNCHAFYNFSFLEYRQWWSRAERNSILNMNIRLPIFWSTWSQALGLDSDTWAGPKMLKPHTVFWQSFTALWASECVISSSDKPHTVFWQSFTALWASGCVISSSDFDTYNFIHKNYAL